jgi:restriction system protein
MECLGPQCASMLLEWLKEQSESIKSVNGQEARQRQATLWIAAPYEDDVPAICSLAELAGAFEHLEYAVYRRFQNQLTRSERLRLDNTILNALFKIDRYAERLEDVERLRVRARCQEIRDTVRQHREQLEHQRRQARRAELKLSQLGALTPEGFEEFVAELFEALGCEVEHRGGTGDQGVDLRVRREGLLAIVQCKYHSRGVVGSPDLQRFLGTIHHTSSHKGFFVTTSTFSLAAERFAAEHPIELIDGPRLIELIEGVLGSSSRRERDPAWF